MLDYILFPLFKLGFYYCLLGLLFTIAYCSLVPHKEILMKRLPLPKMAITGICGMLGEQYISYVTYVYCAAAWPFIGYQEAEEAIRVIKKPKN